MVLRTLSFSSNSNTLQLYRLEHQMSYGLGRPAIVREDATIHRARLLLDHPLALDSDARLIYAVELLSIRGTYQQLSH